jgi:hypothetical protein
VPRGGELSGNCGTAPGHGRLRSGSAIAAGRRYVFGVVGGGVEQVSASLGEAGDGWFVLDLGPPRTDGRPAPPAVITPLTRHGHRVGPPYVDCSLGGLSPACKRRVESTARR